MCGHNFKSLSFDGGFNFYFSNYEQVWASFPMLKAHSTLFSEESFVPLLLGYWSFPNLFVEVIDILKKIALRI